MTGAGEPTAPPPPAPVDSRMMQANERTLLAWMRTGISLITFGFVIARIGVWARTTGEGNQVPGAGWIGALFVLLGAVVDGLGIGRYVMFHRAFLRNEPAPTGVIWVLLVAGAVASLGVLLGAFVILSLHL